MSLTAGDRLGPYEITGLLGKGGMGEVYRASDSRLEREVAIKVSAERFTDRFARETHAIAALNHPNICTLYDVGPDYLVMELVEGPTLAERIGEGPIPLEEALGIAKQIAVALEAAHEKGITHRDLKPANVKVRPDGTVKVLDFGLAKMAEPVSAPGSDPEDSPTLTMGATKAGVILGTAGYMAPEQARGKRVDRRADIWAFGVILYEMLTGKRLFEGETASDTLAAVLKEEPKLDVVPRRVQRLLKSCLEKSPKDRLRDVADAWKLLDDAPAALQARRFWLWPAAAATATLVAATFGVLWLRQPAPEIVASQFEVFAPGDAQYMNTNASTAISPDGRYLVFRADSDLWLRPLDSLAAQRLPGTGEANFPFWSPDSRSVAFFAGGKLKRLDIAGGAPWPLCDAVSYRLAGVGGSWSRDDVILIGGQGLRRIPASGGVPQPLTQADATRKETEHGYPQFLPDGKRFLYFIASADPNTRGVYASSLDHPGERVRVLATDVKALYTAPVAGRPGYLLWLREQSLMAQPFDAGSLSLQGDLTLLAEDVGALGARGAFWASDAGLLVYRSGQYTKQLMTWIGRDGKRLGEAGEADAYSEVRLSPDGKRASLACWDATSRDYDIWLFEFGRGVPTRITVDPARDNHPVWSPDGRQIAFSSTRSGVPQIYRKDAGGGAEEQLTEGPNSKWLSDWSRDSGLLYSEVNPGMGDWDLWVLPLEGDRKPVAVLQTPFRERDGRFSPDGRWVAYASNESGQYEVYVRAFPSTGGQRQQVSIQGGHWPRWRGDGRELFYVIGNAMMAADIRAAGTSIESDIPRELFTSSGLTLLTGYPYDVTADGQRFLVLEPVAGAQGQAPLTVVLNWQAGLKQSAAR